MTLNVEYRKNPKFGQPGEPEMLPPVETVCPDGPLEEKCLTQTEKLAVIVSALADKLGVDIAAVEQAALDAK